FQQTGVQTEYLTGIRFEAWRSAQQQGDLAVRPSLLGQIIINDQCVLAAITEVFSHGAIGEGSDALHRSRISRRRRNHDGVVHGAVLFQLAHYVGDGRLLLANRNVDTLNAGTFLVDDGVDRHGGLTDLTVTDDQLTLTTTTRGHGVD